MKLNYRADIDGLRAVAVLAVVLNHLGISIFSGGYIGVDVFFVISGFLITKILANELSNDNFSILRFYQRRIIRIFPALFAMLFFITIASLMLYDANSLKLFGKSLKATTLFYSNFQFWSETGYFDAPSQLKPLLHTWSLAVEEQFYIAFPCLLWLVYKFARKYLTLSLTFFWVVSFGIGIYQVTQNPATAFYLPYARAWELLTGSLLAIDAFPYSQSNKTRNTLSILGLVLILLPIFIYNEGTLFPGPSAIPPVVGTALIIFAGTNGESLAGRWLSLKPIVFIGLISYSLYLWHWPIIVMTKYYLIIPLTASQIIALFLICIAISTLSWRYIETPFRSQHKAQASTIFKYAGSAMLASIIISQLVMTFNPTAGVKENDTAAKSERTSRWQGSNKTCKTQSGPYSFKICDVGAKSHQPVFIVWGDSFAEAQSYGIHLAATKYNMAGKITYKVGCPPLFGIARKDTPACLKNNNNVLKYLEDNPNIEIVILSSRWTLTAEGSGYKNGQPGTPNLDEANSGIEIYDGLNPQNRDKQTNLEVFSLGISRTIEKLLSLNKQVILVGQVPEVGFDVPTAYSIAKRTNRDLNQIIAPTYDEYLERSQNVRNVFDELVKKYNIKIVDPSTMLCDENICKVVLDERVLYKDLSHLSIFGSEYVSDIFDPVFEDYTKNR